MERNFAGQRMTADSLARIFGAIFVIVGISGFIPNPLVSYRGVFEVITLHVLAVIYAIITIVGFISLNALSFLAVDHPDDGLRLLIAIALLWSGYSLPAEARDCIATAHM